MASSGDEEEVVPRSVSEYYFEDERREPISFAELPVQWRDGENTGVARQGVVLRGKVDRGIRNVYMPVTAWKFDLSDAKLKIFVLSKNLWVKLQSPKKSYAEDFIRTILITLHVLHYCRNNPKSSGKALGDHLSQVYRSGLRPSKDDLRDHMDLVGEAVKKDKVLAKSKYVITLLDEKDKKTKKIKAFAEDAKRPKTTGMSEVLCDDMIEEVKGLCSDDDDEHGKGVCDICDDGGTILRCEGECLRSFHPTVENNCESLGFADDDEVEAICNVFCKNCKYKRHQCFICGKLGSSDKDSAVAVAEVFRCVNGECGRFYHPLCVSKLLHRGNEDETRLLKEKIANGASFTCPIHKCSVCNQGEIERDDQLRFAVCRRCPKSYHRKCLPREISFEPLNDEGITVRAWDTVLPKKRILIYCLDHEIDMLLGTPIRNHVKFPIMKKKNQASEVLSSGQKAEMNKKTPALAKDASREKSSVKSPIETDKRSSATNLGAHKRTICLPGRPDSSKKHKAIDDSHMPLNKSSLNGKCTLNKNKTCHDVKSCTEEKNSLPTLGAESEKSILAMMKDVSSSITVEDIYTKHKRLTTNANLSQNAVDKITLGKVQGSVQALHVALQKLDEGCSIEDAKAVCGPGLLRQMTQWKTKLKVYLEPFLLGVHYTSHGRHFTKSDKLQKIVDILHSYIQEDDMIVDFGCGANEFSCLMKKKLDDVGKKCSYKNYDIIHPKNDFHFERRNWMSVHPTELLPGSQLIIGLNPPYGVDASRANQFINKALEFKPKLIVLIVPSETERLDRKNPPYDLLFEDNELLTGEAFYLPGSVDVTGKQMEQWNIPTPSLYFWSRPDWTAKHKAIAQQQGHLCRGAEVSHTAKSVHIHNDITDLPPADNVLVQNLSPQYEKPKQLQEIAACVTKCHEEALLHDHGRLKKLNKNRNRNNRFNRKRKSRRRHKEQLQADDNLQTGSLPCPSQPIETPLDTGFANKSNGTSTEEDKEDVFRKNGACIINKSNGASTEDKEDLSRKNDTSTKEDKDQHLAERNRNLSECRKQFRDIGSMSSIDDSQCQSMVVHDPKSSTPNNFAADLCVDRMNTCALTQSTESYHTKGNIRLDLLGFAPGPYRPCLQNNSAGWLDE